MSINYKTNRDVQAAKLFGCRGKDLLPGNGIARGEIVLCKHGFNLAEKLVPDVTAATTAAFASNGQCVWGPLTLPCMYLPGSPRGKQLKGMNYVVAQLQNDAAVHYAESLGINIVKDDKERNLINLEIDRFSGQSKERRAMLL